MNWEGRTEKETASLLHIFFKLCIKIWLESSTLLRTQTYFSLRLSRGRHRAQCSGLCFTSDLNAGSRVMVLLYWALHGLQWPSGSSSCCNQLQLCPSERLNLSATGERFRRTIGGGKSTYEEAVSISFTSPKFPRVQVVLPFGACLQLSLTTFWSQEKSGPGLTGIN